MFKYEKGRPNIDGRVCERPVKGVLTMGPEFRQIL
jgi:hypothetical protein